MRYKVIAVLLAAASTATLSSANAKSQPVPTSPEIGRFGLDTNGMDPSIAPGDDFYGYANGKWDRRTEIPADRSNVTAFTALAISTEERLRAILEASANDPASKIGAAYASFMDEAAVEARGLAPIRPWLARIEAVASTSDYVKLLAEARRAGVPGVIGMAVVQDDKNPDAYALRISQGGIGLPDRQYYLDDTPAMRDIRQAYLGHLETMLRLAGVESVAAAARAAAILAFETDVARAQWSRVESRDVSKAYNKLSVEQLAASLGSFDIRGLVTQASGAEVRDVIVSQPDAIGKIAALVVSTDSRILRDQIIVRSLESFAEVLPRAVGDPVFDFYSKRLSGIPEQRPRWKRGVDFVEDALGEELGQAYVARHFTPETKARIDQLVGNVIAAMGQRIDALDWMTPATKQKARAKLAAFTPKIGYPDKWRDYSSLKIDRNDLFANELAARRFQASYSFGKLGKPIDRSEWLLTPQTINAYANPVANEIVFPAAVLQPPFFDPNADDAVNYGGIGAVIGHEISHHFDDQGAKYDAHGRLSDWWTTADNVAFAARTDKLAAQFDLYEPLPGKHVNGKLTLGENIADLAGLAVAYDAWQASLEGKAPPAIDGMSGDQRFYLGWAQVWRARFREPSLEKALLTQVHSPAMLRALTARNFDRWYEAFAVKPGEKLYLAPAQRVRIW